MAKSERKGGSKKQQKRQREAMAAKVAEKSEAAQRKLDSLLG